MKIAKAMIGAKSTYLPAYREGLFTYMRGFSSYPLDFMTKKTAKFVFLTETRGLFAFSTGVGPEQTETLRP